VPIPVPLAPKKSGEQALGRSRGGFSCKIHITVDALGNPLRLVLTAGQRHDSTQATAAPAGEVMRRADGLDGGGNASKSPKACRIDR
jgi:hypothetical protein